MATDNHIQLGMRNATNSTSFDALPPRIRALARPDAKSLLQSGQNIALFLDFDGTLAKIAAQPDAVRVPAATRHLLAQLHRALGGAVAIITGREISTIDQHFAPLQLATAGVHGLVRRDAAGHTSSLIDAVAASRLPGLVDATAAPLLRRHRALTLEYKTGAVALHYRGAPDQAAACVAVMQAVADQLLGVGVRLCHGRQVVEVVAGHSNKGAAVTAFLAGPPFRNRLPVFIGDDVTDEDGFAAVHRHDGLSIKVGDGSTIARHRLADPEIVFNWLNELGALLRQR
jgi:trehalose 6-phosphate phosphatase